MNDWLWDLDNAIEDLENRKSFLMKSCVTCWDPSIDWALDALKIIRKMVKINHDECRITLLESLILTMHYGKEGHYKESNDND